MVRQKTGNPLYLEKEKFLKPAEGSRRISHDLLVRDLSGYHSSVKKPDQTLPLAWKGDGSNPLVIFRGGKDDPGNTISVARGAGQT